MKFELHMGESAKRLDDVGVTLDAIRLANFKAFGTSQRIPLRPITLLFGANSTGKSSVLHGLALAHHAIETGDLDTQQTRIGGESIDLGGFHQYVHRRRPDRQVELTFELDLTQPTKRLHSAERATVEFVVSNGPSRGSEATQPDRAGRTEVERFVLTFDEQPLLSMSARPSGLLRLDRLNHTHPVFREAFREVLMLATTPEQPSDADFAGLADQLNRLVPNVTAQREGLLPRIDILDEQAVAGAAVLDLLELSNRGRRQEALAQAAELFLAQVLGQLIAELAEVLTRGLRQLLYLGPLRSYPPRHLAFSQDYDANWFAGGGYAWEVVRKREDVRARVNEWLGDSERLKTPYELQVRELLPAGGLEAELAPRLGGKLYELARSLLEDVEQGVERSDSLASVLGLIRQAVEGQSEGDDEIFAAVGELVDSIVDAELVAEEWTEEIVRTRGEGLRDLVLIDKRSSTPVSHRDVGIGVSQVLPVLVYAYASSGRLIAIEQPEIHLHPALQADLGDVFLESALGGAGNRFLIETHSEHLILRILRRIRETSEGDLPKDLTPVRPEDVAVLYVQPGASGAEIIELPITPDGEFERRWPDGFFAERAKELF